MPTRRQIWALVEALWGVTVGFSSAEVAGTSGVGWKGPWKTLGQLWTIGDDQRLKTSRVKMPRIEIVHLPQGFPPPYPMEALRAGLE